MPGQSAVRGATTTLGIEMQTGVLSGVNSRGRKNFVQPMGMAEFDRSDSGEFSAPMGARESSEVRAAEGRHGKSEVRFAEGRHGKSEVRAAAGQHGTSGVNHATNRFASGLGRHEGGAVTPSDVADRRGIETRPDRLGESSAGANVVASGRLANELSSHVGSTALPSDSIVADQGADRSISGADRIADLHDDSMSRGNISSDCARARGAAECRAGAGNIPAVVEQHTAAGDSRNLATCADFPLCDSVNDAGAATPSQVIDNGTASPRAVEFINSPVPGLYLRNDRLINDRSRFGRRTNSVLDDANDANVKFDEFGYLYEESDDELTDISDISCATDEFGDFAHQQDVVITQSPVVENAPECETRNGSAGLRKDCIDVDSAVFDENCSQRPCRNLQRPAKYDDFSVVFANSQYIRRIKRCTLPECGYSSSQASDVLLTSRDRFGLSDRPLIGQHACPDQGLIHKVNNSRSNSISRQLSDRFCGDNLVNGDLTFLECCAFDGGILYGGEDPPHVVIRE